MWERATSVHPRVLDYVREREGVIKFAVDSRQQSTLLPEMVVDLNGWRYILHGLQLIGQSPERYNGYGFGNISIRVSEPQKGFVISGTQTGKPSLLHLSEYVLVTDCDLEANSITSQGEIAPSSEALTHGQVYSLENSVRCVVHAHSPNIWKNAERLGLPFTSRDVEYGTAEMANEVRQLFTHTEVRSRKIFAMGGHEDGVVSFGSNLKEACTIMIETLASAVALNTFSL